MRAVLETEWADHIPECDRAMHTGPRLWIYGLGWQDVDLSRRLLLVRRGKNGDARYARLNSVALSALEQLRKRSDGTGPVVRNSAGEPLCGPRYWFEKAISKAGISDFHWHDLRHTFALRLAIAGVGLRAIQEPLATRVSL